MSFGNPDRVPLFREGMREEVLAAWQAQGLPLDADLAKMFHYDELEEIEPDLTPHPSLSHLPAGQSGLRELQRRLDPDDPTRLPAGWQELVRGWSGRQQALSLRVHRGFFLTMGVEDWGSFTEAIRLLKDDPGLVHEVMAIQADFAARLAENILREVEVDAVIFSEPIAGNHGPLISPRMYEDFVLDSFEPVLDVVESYHVKTIILRTYANPHALLAAAFKRRFNCLWACVCNMESMDFRRLRAELGSKLRLIGGIDAGVLLQDKGAIRQELEEKLPPLLEQGGFVPLADGRVREDVPFENYVYYRRLLEEIVINR